MKNNKSMLVIKKPSTIFKLKNAYKQFRSSHMSTLSATLFPKNLLTTKNLNVATNETLENKTINKTNSSTDDDDLFSTIPESEQHDRLYFALSLPYLYYLLFPNDHSIENKIDSSPKQSRQNLLLSNQTKNTDILSETKEILYEDSPIFLLLKNISVIQKYAESGTGKNSRPSISNADTYHTQSDTVDDISELFYMKNFQKFFLDKPQPILQKNKKFNSEESAQSISHLRLSTDKDNKNEDNTKQSKLSQSLIPVINSLENNTNSFLSDSFLTAKSISFVPKILLKFLNLGTTLNGIKIHTGPWARRINQIYGSRALTINKNILLDDNPNMSSFQTMSLLAHELTHIKQQEDIHNSNKHLTPLTQMSLESEARANESIIGHILRQTRGMGFGSSAVMENYYTKYLQFRSDLVPLNVFSSSAQFIPSKPDNQQFSSDVSHIANDTSPPELVYSKTHNTMNWNLSSLNMSAKSNFKKSSATRASDANQSSHPSTVSNTPMLSRDDDSNSDSFTRQIPNITQPMQPTVDYNFLAEIVYRLIEEKIKNEQERRGYR